MFLNLILFSLSIRNIMNSKDIVLRNQCYSTSNNSINRYILLLVRSIGAELRGEQDYFEILILSILTICMFKNTM